MRDVLLTLIVIGAIPYILKQPYVGVLVWSWLGYMNPQRLTWGFAYSLPFSQIVAIALLSSLLMSKEDKRLPINALTVTWLIFIVWMAISTAFAIYPEDAFQQLDKVFKIQLIIFLTMMIMKSPERIKMMVWVIYFSLGFWGIKGGYFTIVTGGGYRVWGPEGTFIEDNNHLAAALLVIVPLGFYLYQTVENKYAKWGILLSVLLIAVSSVGSQSRGAFLAIIASSLFLWLKSRKKLMLTLVVLPLLPVLYLFMPQSWHDRMATITSHEEDASAQGRLNSWAYAINVASDRVTGAGFESWSRETFLIWAPDPTTVNAAHSIYFAVLADHGWPGLIMFVSIFYMGWRMNARVIKATKDHTEWIWMGDLSRMIQVSFVAYASGGAFLSLAYFDLPWHLLAIVVLLDRLARERGLIRSKVSYAEKLALQRGASRADMAQNTDERLPVKPRRSA